MYKLAKIGRIIVFLSFVFLLMNFVGSAGGPFTLTGGDGGQISFEGHTIQLINSYISEEVHGCNFIVDNTYAADHISKGNSYKNVNGLWISLFECNANLNEAKFYLGTSGCIPYWNCKSYIEGILSCWDSHNCGTALYPYPECVGTGTTGNTCSIDSRLPIESCDEISINVLEVCYDNKKDTVNFLIQNTGSVTLINLFVLIKDTYGGGRNTRLTEGGEPLYSSVTKQYVVSLALDPIDTISHFIITPDFFNYECSEEIDVFIPKTDIRDCDSNELLFEDIDDTLEINQQGTPTFPNISSIKKPNWYIYLIILFGVVVLFFALKGFFKKEDIGKSLENKQREIEYFESKIKPSKKAIKKTSKINTNVDNAIEVSNLSMRRGRTGVLNDIGFKIKNGDFCAIVGVSGGGKSSIIEAIVGRKEYTGTIKIYNQKLNQDIKSIIGFVPQSPELYMNQTVEQNMQNSCTKWGISKDVIEDTLDKLHLSHRKNLEVKKLSGGQLKLLSLGMELIRDPELLILDEPTTGLDPENRNQIITILSQLSSKYKKTVIITTHFMDDADEADDVILVKEGKIVIQGSPSKLIKMMPGSGKIINIILDEVNPNLLSKIEKIAGVKKIIRDGRSLKIITTEPNPIKLGNKITDIGGIIDETKSINATMAEVFVYYIGKLEE